MKSVLLFEHLFLSIVVSRSTGLDVRTNPGKVTLRSTPLRFLHPEFYVSIKQYGGNPLLLYLQPWFKQLEDGKEIGLISMVKPL